MFFYRDLFYRSRRDLGFFPECDKCIFCLCICLFCCMPLLFFCSKCGNSLFNFLVEDLHCRFFLCLLAIGIAELFFQRALPFECSLRSPSSR